MAFEFEPGSDPAVAADQQGIEDRGERMWRARRELIVPARRRG